MTKYEVAESRWLVAGRRRMLNRNIPAAISLRFGEAFA
jgi:hypothetical protein